MEPHKRAKYSKSLDPDKIEEVLMDEELEDRDEVVKPRVQSSSSSEDEDDAEETKVALRATRAGDSSNFLNFTGPPNVVNRSAASDINAESSPFSVFIFFFRQVLQIHSFISIQPLGRFSRNQNPVRRPVWLWHTASWASS